MFNFPAMHKIFFSILLILGGTNVFAQYIHYSDHRNINKTSSHATTPPPVVQEAPAKVVRDTVKVVVKDTVKMFMKDTVKITVRDTLKMIVHDTIRVIVIDTMQIVIHDTTNICPDVVYHQWPDKCPGLSGSIPVINNYVTPQMILKLTEYYQGHLYSISSNRNAKNKVVYKLKVCKNGQISFEYADENGNIISKPPGTK